MKKSEQSYALLKFKLKKKGIYTIQIVASNELHLLRDVYKIENAILETEQKDKDYTFDIKETIKIMIEKKNDYNFIGKMDKATPIFASKRGYYLKFGIEARNQIKFILSLSFGIYYEYYDKIYPYFIAKTLINDINSINITSLPNTSNDDTNLNRKVTSQISVQNRTGTRKSFSTLNHNTSYAFKDKETNKEIFYDCSSLNGINISLLAQKVTKKVFGLLNLGNTCFLNSALQIILHTPMFIEKFLFDIYKLNPPNSTLAYMLFNLIMTINSSEQKAFSPKSLITKFTEKCTMFSLGEQSDSQRFYRNFVTILEKELGNKNTCIKQTFVGTFKYTNDFFCPNKFCGFRNTNIIEQPFYDIFLSVPEKDSSINELIDQTYRSQILKSSKKCNCGNNFTLNRFCTICPNIYLSVNLQRGKISNRTLKNVEIQIDNIYINDKKFYEPYAINFHTGTMDYGHYYSYIKIDEYQSGGDTGKWYCFNDSNVSNAACPQSSREVINVFYKLI